MRLFLTINYLFLRDAEFAELYAIDGFKNKWSFVKKLGGAQSGQAVVFLVQDNVHKKCCVVKKYKPAKCEDDARRAYREVVALKRLEAVSGVPRVCWTNINSENDAVEKNDKKVPLCLVMTLAPGSTIRTSVNNKPILVNDKPSFLRVIEFTLRLATIVKDIHAQGIFHRDIKPDNIMVAQDHLGGDITVVDFGLAFLSKTSNQKEMDTPLPWDASDGETSTDVGTRVGNKFYRPPQMEAMPTRSSSVLLGELRMAGRRRPVVDASGCCAILFWLLTGQDPQNAEDEVKLQPHQRPIGSRLMSQLRQRIPDQSWQPLVSVFATYFTNDEASALDMDKFIRWIKDLIHSCTDKISAPDDDQLASLFASSVVVAAQPRPKQARSAWQTKAANWIKNAKDHTVSAWAKLSVKFNPGVDNCDWSATSVSSAVSHSCILSRGPAKVHLEFTASVAGNLLIMKVSVNGWDMVLFDVELPQKRSLNKIYSVSILPDSIAKALSVSNLYAPLIVFARPLLLRHLYVLLVRNLDNPNCSIRQQ